VIHHVVNLRERERKLEEVKIVWRSWK